MAGKGIEDVEDDRLPFKKRGRDGWRAADLLRVEVSIEDEPAEISSARVSQSTGGERKWTLYALGELPLVGESVEGVLG